MLPSQAFFLPITGEVNRALIYPYRYLKSLPSRTVTMVLECSGNKRSKFHPKVYGEQWEDGAISQGMWKGVPLRDFIYYPHTEDDLGKKPVTNIKTDSIIQQPLNYTTLDAGVHNIYGIAWTGQGIITDVELSF